MMCLPESDYLTAEELYSRFKADPPMVIDDALAELMSEDKQFLICVNQSDDDFIVATSYQVIKKHLKKLTDANGYSLTFHDLRHLNASVMLMLGIPDTRHPGQVCDGTRRLV